MGVGCLRVLGIFCCEYGMHETGVLSTSACASMYLHAIPALAVTSVFDISLHIWKHPLRRSCTCARVCAVCSLMLGDEGGGVQLVYAGHLLLVWDDDDDCFYYFQK